MSKIRLTWFANSHDHSLHYLKFGLMILARQKQIDFEDRPVAAAQGWLSPELRNRNYRRIVLVGVEWGRHRRLIAFDGEDSPFQLSDLIKRVDLYYTCTYCPHLYENHNFNFRLSWQREDEIVYYLNRFNTLIKAYSSYFEKVRPFAPIGPNLDTPQIPITGLPRRLHNARHKVRLRFRGSVDWLPQFERFNRRWDGIRQMRTLKPNLDVVLLDSLWGWPRHRIALHQHLAQLADAGYSIRSKLNFRQPTPYELGDFPAPVSADFPMTVGFDIGGDYEKLLASTRLGVFATGFHYGWRNIVTLSWAMGIRTLQDRFTYKFLYDPSPFCVTVDSNNWNLAPCLDQARVESVEQRQVRWKHFDAVASPERISELVVDQLKSELF